MVIDVRLLHSWKAVGPMFVTLAGMFIDARLLHWKNALSPMFVRVEGRDTALIELHL